MRRLAALVTILVLAVSAAQGTAEAAPAREKWDTRVFSLVPSPGYPAYVLAHRNGRVYAGSYSNPQGDSQRSRVFEWSGSGALLRSWTVPGQDLTTERGVQVANQDARGRLVLLEKSRARVMTLDVRSGRFHTWATLPDLPTCTPGTTGPDCSPNAADLPAIPNYATWGPGGALYVTDYGQAVIWKIPRGTVEPRVWFASPQLDGSDFGTTGIVFRPGRRDFLISQQSTAVDASVPTDGKLYALPLLDSGRPGTLATLWTSSPGDLPDGFGIARSGHVYVANAGLSNQLVELGPDGTEIARFPDATANGSNGSSIPFDTPSSATFFGTRVLVANQSYFGDTSHHAILDVQVGERGRATYLPDNAFWS
ncbi:sugar lactone lactonase YvrE [Nocardioides ginsengisegetis]|uniref:Sugar lactone lactonase YvrE n=1 Tax=Nocardioides ginsengisegetis TaxID=661491 RepID=A0A7W3P820_9ACTN|nr:hypothetical protein [Nocardioides ginsengisegetis]MBA8801941.1 sugar lactone lactonase YvrE [Nocardioides ginsengisegetis]